LDGTNRERSDSQIASRCKEWLARQRAEAAKVTLDYLLEQEHNERLGNCIYGHEDKGLLARFGHGPLVEEPIPTLDSKAQARCIRDYKELMKRYAAYMDLAMEAEAEVMEKQCGILRSYLRENTFKGMIKNFPDCESKHRQSVRKKLAYLLKKARREDPEVHRYLSELLRNNG
jgi:hypothetical protein